MTRQPYDRPARGSDWRKGSLQVHQEQPSMTFETVLWVIAVYGQGGHR